MSDSELARKLYEDEQRAIKEAAKVKAEADRLLAEELWRKEKEQEEERKKKKEWEETLELIKQQAKAESDKELGTSTIKPTNRYAFVVLLEKKRSN